MALAAVIFDFFGTLTPGTPDARWARHAALSAAPLGIPATMWNRALDDSLAEVLTVLGARQS